VSPRDDAVDAAIAAIGLAPPTNSDARGPARWNALARGALAECLGDHDPRGAPLVIGSCNGGAATLDEGAWSSAFDTRLLLEGTPWAGAALPVASASCASGLHALFLARALLARGAPEAIVLSVDVHSEANRANFESLRVLSERGAPWQATNEGFALGEAAVALRVVRGDAGASLTGPTLGHDLRRAEGLAWVLRESRGELELVLGQGTGPSAVDSVELEAVARVAPASVPLATPLVRFGHTLGSSGLLSLALAARSTLARQPALAMPFARASDGRPLVTRPRRVSAALAVCRALGGACAAARVGGGELATPAATWVEPVDPGPLQHPLLRRLAREAPEHRPESAPVALVVRLEAPLTPPPRARIGGRLLPTAVLELTPGALPLLVARRWGLQGPALCLVGPRHASEPLLAALGDVARVDVVGEGAARELRWG